VKKLAVGVVGLMLLFPLLVVAVVSIGVPALEQQLGEIQCVTPTADKTAAGQLSISTGRGDLDAGPGSDFVTGPGGAKPLFAPSGYVTEPGGRPDEPIVGWRTDRWSAIEHGIKPLAAASGHVSWVTLRARNSHVVSVLSLDRLQPPGVARLNQLVTSLSRRGPVLVTGETGTSAARFHPAQALAASRMVPISQLLHKHPGPAYVLVRRGSGLVPVQQRTPKPGRLVVDLSWTEATAGTGAATPAAGRLPAGVEEGGIGFALPAPGQPRRASAHNQATAIPARIKGYYLAAARRYQVPWTLLAGIGMEETNHGRNTATSTAGAQGLMQFMPETWARYGADGNHDGRADIDNDADSAMGAANYLTASGVTKGAAGVRRALFAYNHADWYVNDVLAYAHAYGGGTVLGDPTDCGTGDGNPALPALSTDRAKKLLTWAQAQLGEPYVFGSNGPSSWDCSSYSRTAYAQIGITLPRTAQAQRDWLAHGNGYRVPTRQARPGDLVFTNTYRGPNAIGHVMLVFDPAHGTSIEAVGAKVAYDRYTRYAGNHIFEIWRVGNVADEPSTHPA